MITDFPYQPILVFHRKTDQYYEAVALNDQGCVLVNGVDRCFRIYRGHTDTIYGKSKFDRYINRAHGSALGPMERFTDLFWERSGGAGEGQQFDRFHGHPG